MKLAALFLLDGRDYDDRNWKRHNPPPVAAPEPATYARMAIGLGAIMVIGQRRRK